MLSLQLPKTAECCQQDFVAAGSGAGVTGLSLVAATATTIALAVFVM